VSSSTHWGATDGQLIVQWNRFDNPVARLFCLAEAAAGAGSFRHWVTAAAPDIELYAFRLPGRENRINEAPLTERAVVLESLECAIQPFVASGVPFGLFGHCSGALLMYDLAKALVRRGYAPTALFLGSQGAPKLFVPTGSYALEKGELRRQLRETSHYTEALENEDILELVEPILRADLQVADFFQAVQGDPIDIHLSVFGSLFDRYFSPAGFAAWAEETTQSFTLRLLRDDHLLQGEWLKVGADAASDLRTLTRKTGDVGWKT
jgi:medium-chain acyl-[acyl-carrier-protein] hydrolase